MFNQLMHNGNANMTYQSMFGSQLQYFAQLRGKTNVKILNAIQVLQNQSLWKTTFKKSHGSANLAKNLEMFRFTTP